MKEYRIETGGKLVSKSLNTMGDDYAIVMRYDNGTTVSFSVDRSGAPTFHVNRPIELDADAGQIRVMKGFER